MNIINRLQNTFVFVCASPISNEWIVEHNNEYYTISCYIVANIVRNYNSDAEMREQFLNKIIKLNLVDTENRSLDQLRDLMDSNGYSYEDTTQFKLKNNQPCYISENADSLDEVESWLSLYIKTRKYLEDMDVLKDYCEAYGKEDLIPNIDASKALKSFSFNSWYYRITETSIAEVIETKINLFMDETDKWTSFDTYLNN